MKIITPRFIKTTRFIRATHSIKTTRSLYLFLLSFLCAADSCPGYGQQGFLHTYGKSIINGKGEKIILRGMGLGGWMLQEGYMLHLGNIGQQYHIKEKIQELVGQEKTEKFYDDWLANNTRKIDIDSMAAWGFNSVRLPMHYHLFTPAVDEEPIAGQNTWLEKGFAITDSLLNWCKANKIYLILDMHATPGGQGNDLPISDRNPAKPSLWESEANRQKLIALWKRLAARYANETWIGGYDIINEPNWGFEDPADIRGTAEKRNEPLKALMMDITRAIRSVDKNHMIIIEGNGFGNNYRGILPVWDNNMALSFHKYGNFNTEAAIRQFLDLREKYNVPLWLGESGENSNTWYTEAIRLVESRDIGWSWWPLKKMGNNNPLEVKLTPAYQRLLDYWNGKGPRPSESEADGALQELVENVKLENNIYHKDVTDAMFRQVRLTSAQSTSAQPTLPQSASTGQAPAQPTATLPFSALTVPAGKDTLTIMAVDYDLGPQGAAYFDRDTASYNFTPGVKTTGNRGHVYRNDGVDIQQGSSDRYNKEGYIIFSIENGEWLQYTITVEKKGRYTVGLKVAAAADTGRISLAPLHTADLSVPNTGGPSEWQTIEVKGVFLDRGTNRLKVYARKGGFNLAAITISN